MHWIYTSFQLDDDASLDELMDKFEEYFVPKQNITFERYKFFSCDQKQGVGFDQYLAELHTLSKTCEFGNLKDSLVRDKIVCGIPDNGLRERLLREQNLTLDKTINMCRAAETTRAQAKELRKEETAVHAIKTGEQYSKHPNKYKSQREAKADFKCGKCGGSHKPMSCPAYGKECHNCGKKNHFSKYCKADAFKKKKVHAVEEEPKEFFVDAVHIKEAKDEEEWIVPLTVNRTIIPFKLDTGASVNLISVNEYEKLTVKSKIFPVKTKVSGYTGEKVPVKGGCIATF